MTNQEKNTTICKDRTVYTLINVFSVEPSQQEELVNVLVEATEETMRHLPGFLSANIHKSYDGNRVVNYAQWRSREDFEAMLQNEAARPHMAKAAAMASYDPILCEVAHVDHIA